MEEKQQEYEQSIGKAQAIKCEMEEKKMLMEHEFRMKKLDKEGNYMIYSSTQEAVPPTDEKYLN